MTKGIAWMVELAAWIAPLAWAIPWALFRGENAHGGYAWWGHAHLGGLTFLVLTALFARWWLWTRVSATKQKSRRRYIFGQVALTATVLVANWLSFQTGMALHESPASLGEFLWADP